MRVHRVVVSTRTSTLPASGQRERVHHRPRSDLEMEVVEVAQHCLAVRPSPAVPYFLPGATFPVTGFGPTRAVGEAADVGGWSPPSRQCDRTGLSAI